MESRLYRNFYSGYNRKFQITYAEIIGIRRTIARGTHELLTVPMSCWKVFILKTRPQGVALGVLGPPGNPHLHIY